MYILALATLRCNRNWKNSTTRTTLWRGMWSLRQSIITSILFLMVAVAFFWTNRLVLPLTAFNFPNRFWLLPPKKRFLPIWKWLRRKLPIRGPRTATRPFWRHCWTATWTSQRRRCSGTRPRRSFPQTIGSPTTIPAINQLPKIFTNVPMGREILAIFVLFYCQNIAKKVGEKVETAERNGHQLSNWMRSIRQFTSIR